MPIEKIKTLLNDPEASEDTLKKHIEDVELFDIARRLHELSLEEKTRLFQLLKSDEDRQFLLYETDHDSRLEIQESIDTKYLAKLLGEMDEDEAADILQEHPEETQQEILDKMKPQEARTIKDLITYEEETAGGLMTVDFQSIRGNPSAADILMKLKREINYDRAPYFYWLDDGGRLKGYFKLRDLLGVSTQARVSEFVRPEMPKVHVNDSCEKIANLMDHERLSALAVVDDDNVMQGIITFDDVIRTMQDIANEDIFTMVGTAKVDPFAKSIRAKILARAPWLFTTFAGGLISAFIIGIFKANLLEFATVVLFIPFVIGLAGNVGIQGATVIVRGLATGDIKDDNLPTVARSELWVGLFNGLIFGILCGAFVAALALSFLDTTGILGVIVGTGIFLAVGFASLIGTVTPPLFLKMNIDPAISTGPFVTVMNDIAGVAIYLSTAWFYFNYW